MPSTSSSGAVGTVLAVDANVLLSCLLRGEALRVLTSPRLTFFTTLRTTWEVARYPPYLVERLASVELWLDEAQLEADFHRFPVVPLPDSFYGDCLPKARELIEHRDPTDVDILTLTLRLDVPLWTNDRDFDGLPEVRTLSTAEAITILLGPSRPS